MRAAPWPRVRNLHAVHVRAPPRRSWSDIDSRSFPGTSLPCEMLNTRVVTFRAAALANGRGPSNCESKLHNCTDLVKPFLNDLRYMFPTTIEDVDDMCKMWSRFVDCIRRYVTDCATEDQRSKFNNAVGDSIDTVHAICSSERYQKGEDTSITFFSFECETFNENFYRRSSDVSPCTASP
ncbi:hypothetical protein MTO96_039966 [Rhipicephalus appendiculatus]